VKYRQRNEVVKGESLDVDVTLLADGNKAKVKVHYYRDRTVKDVETTTRGTLDLGVLSLDQLACVGRTIATRLEEARVMHEEYVADLMSGIARRLNA
jgi:hypothetical protein